MSDVPSVASPHRHSAFGRLTGRCPRGIGVTAAVGIAYFLIAEIGLGLYGQTNWVSVFWPAFGVSAGVLIALGPNARLPVAIGVVGAILLAHLIIGDPHWLGPAFGLADAAEAVVTAGLVQHFFGAHFSLGRLRHLVGLLGAAMCGSVASFSVWICMSTLFQGSREPILTTWQHWFIGDMVGFVALGPFVIGLFAAVRDPPGWRELIEGAAALLGLALITAVIIFLPRRFWEVLLPVAWVFPVLFWLAARCRPLFTAAGVFIVSMTVVWTTVFGIGHFGSAGLPFDERNLQAQATILVVALGALILAALFAERRGNETRLASSNELLARERDNKLLGAQAITGAIAHEIKQPLTAIVANGEATLEVLRGMAPNYHEVRAAVKDMIDDANRAGETIDGIRALYRGIDRRKEAIDLNEIVTDVLDALQEELNDHRVTVRAELTSKLSLVPGNRLQLREVVFNLVHNAVEAMDTIADRDRVLWVSTEVPDRDTVAVAVQDTGPGIEPSEAENVFEAFFTTKEKGMGLGLAICRLIVEHHGGRLSALSNGKDGALFRFVLPVASV